MLILFDVDGTLLLTQRAGVLAMEDAGRELFGDDFVFDVACAGRLDPLIFSSLAKRNGVPDTPETHDRFRRCYGEHLKERLETNPTSTLLPGVRALLDRLQAESAMTLGLLTGNYPETGRLKIQAAGLDPEIFLIQAWGDEAPHRRELPALAMQRYGRLVGRSISPREVVVIGDTPLDVDCAHANGCIALGVATGPSYSLDELRAHDPDLAVPDLSETDRLLDWLGEIVATQTP